MDVSVVIPTRNRSALLATTLRSVLRQRGVAFEVVVVDDGSTDDTRDVLNGFGDSRIRVIRHDRSHGVSAARNRGIAEARTEWIAFLDDDDLWAPEKLALQLLAARQSGAAWVYVGHVNINVLYKVVGGAPPLDPSRLMQQLPHINVVPGGCSGVMASKPALAVAGEFDSRFQSLADWDLWRRLARVGAPAWVCRPLVAYRLHAQQMSLDLSRIQAEFRILDYDRTANRAVLYRYLGWWALRSGRTLTALTLFVRGGLQRRPEYAWPVLAGDLAVWADAVLARLRIRGIRIANPVPLSEEEGAWRNEGQAWVDELIAAENTAPKTGRRLE